MPVWKPHPYQKKNVKHLLANPGAGLFLDPGLGKTSIVLQAADILLKESIINSVLVVAPLRVCTEVWPKESDKWTQFNHLTVSVLHGPKKEQRLAEPANIYVINPEGLAWLTKQKKWKWPDMLVVDESTKFKNVRSQRFRTLRDRLNKFNRRVILTGTPVPNGLLDLYGQVFLLDGGARLGANYYRYRARYFTETGYMGKEFLPKPDAMDDVQEAVGDICIRMAAEDYIDMPNKITDEINVPLPAKAWKTYVTLDAVFFAKVKAGNVNVANAAVLSGKLRQVVSGAVYDDEGVPQLVHDAKLDACCDLVEEIGSPVIIAYEFDHERARLLQRFPMAGVLGGRSTTKKTSQIVEEWNNGELDVLLCHPASAGHGLNLQDGGHHIIWFGLTWNLEHYDQLNDRLWRQGQKESVFIYHLLAKDTVDERVSKVLAAKDHTQKDLLRRLA